MNREELWKKPVDVAFINPGSGPVDGANRQEAVLSMVVFLADVGLPKVRIESKGKESDGRFEFTLHYKKRKCVVQMPGLPAEQVRYLGKEGQNIWHFPRLYVDGDSWVWTYAVSAARDSLTGQR